MIRAPSLPEVRFFKRRAEQLDAPAARSWKSERATQPVAPILTTPQSLDEFMDALRAAVLESFEKRLAFDIGN